MESIIQTLSANTSGHPITLEQYKSWQKHYTLEALKGVRYGVSFCQHFKILDYRIFFDSTPESCDNIIRKEWIARA